ncbi:MAG: hypothetical protein QGH20_08585 [Candidatus Latescibacteria bacterium]|nr:hypothetical protein [Candidatus Latescibacterota bacterium]
MSDAYRRCVIRLIGRPISEWNPFVTTIRDIRVITTAPSGLNLVVVKVETSEPGLHGIGCATFTQRYTAVKAAIEHPLKELLIGWDVARIEELFQLMMIQGYWRNGPVMNNAISGVDMALWDIKGKMAGMPVYDVLGGKSREAAAVYRHADGSEPSAVLDSFQKIMADGVHHIRVQCGGYGGVPPTVDSAAPHRAHPPDGSLDGAYYDPRRYMRDALAAIGPATITLAEAEGLGAHALSVSIRLNQPKPDQSGE